MIGEIWGSFRAMPIWVQVWVFVLLVPANSASLLFLGEQNGVLIAVLAIGAMFLNGVIMLVERGFSKAMALPHVVIWTPLAGLLAVMLSRGSEAGAFATYLKILLIVDLISLGFDFKDARDWWGGAREVARVSR
jgi:hypothetical protein